MVFYPTRSAGSDSDSNSEEGSEGDCAGGEHSDGEAARAASAARDSDDDTTSPRLRFSLGIHTNVVL
ncbi:hypothetical protein EON68_04660 [archaeon]|nr:MAG: hypothetical protein EON68_04660 [archaeon]